ncbi:Tail Collar domain protein [Desulfofarcimen acetoxidans DSM 771]|uniref:Tail Collar domain protein n=1 Tax=Desulfofarcimen acetoxidans (strain ATCC 49208 / DSM 771 / KCTC 5769 / VKM B-1644 / 5575) TaxID=485916 RepID=C8W2G4_DESAS|nr:tail fiber protein [Desulfofarcimen acetoxidans]ACV63648.1 Tail Collar domain protein [Desulfofarcimen acetoxidans DSM 771]
MEDIYIGTIVLFPYNFTPAGWQLCGGQFCSIKQYEELFRLIGTSYGGDGINNFALPNLAGTEPWPFVKYYIATAGTLPPQR